MLERGLLETAEGLNVRALDEAMVRTTGCCMGGHTLAMIYYRAGCWEHRCCDCFKFNSSNYLALEAFLGFGSHVIKLVQLQLGTVDTKI
jgi:hypothetical protein